MKIFLTIVMCSAMQGACLEPYTFPTGYYSYYDCITDGYKKSLEKLEEIGEQEVNVHGIYLKFDSKEVILPKPKPKGLPL